MKKIYASASAFQQGDIVYTRYASGCLRSILLAANGIREQIKIEYQNMGSEYEDNFARGMDDCGPDYQREVSFTLPIDGYDGVIISGRCDFITDDRVIELKSSQSQGVLKEVVKGGRPKLENLAQLSTYMVAFKKSMAELHYRYIKAATTRNPAVKIDVKFDVDFDDKGSILVNKKSSGFALEDLITHQKSAAEAVTQTKVMQRPFNFTDRFNGPCARCPFSAICDKWDTNVISDASTFIEEARNTIKGNEVTK